MGRGEKDKGLSKQGQQNYDKIEWNSKGAAIKDLMEERLEAHDRELHLAIDRDDKESDET